MPDVWNVVELPALRSNSDDFADAAAELTASFDHCDAAAEAVITVGATGWDGFDGKSAIALGNLVAAVGESMLGLPAAARTMASSLADAAADLLALETRSDQLLLGAQNQWLVYSTALTARARADRRVQAALDELAGVAGGDADELVRELNRRIAEQSVAVSRYWTERNALDDLQSEHRTIRDEEDAIHADVMNAEMSIGYPSPRASRAANVSGNLDGSIVDALDEVIASAHLHPTEVQRIVDARAGLVEFANRSRRFPATGPAGTSDAEVAAWQAWAHSEATGVSPRFWDEVVIPLRSGHMPTWKPDGVEHTRDWSEAELEWITKAYNDWHSDAGLDPHMDTQTWFHRFRDEADYPDHFKGRAFFPGLPNTMFLDLALGLLPVGGKLGGRPPAISQSGGLPLAPRPIRDPFGARPKVTNPDTGSFTPYPSKPPGVPADWVMKRTHGPGGFQYTHPTNPADYVRVMPGNPRSSYPNSRGPYVRWQKDGQALDQFGNKLRTAQVADAHVPAEIFRFDPKVFR